MYYDPTSAESIEKYSSAVSLSDMEIFIFPDLMFALVLANIMSPSPWSWKDEQWFERMDSMKEYKRLQRTKQFIMERFEFNLDLDTWGMTTKEKELERFDQFIDQSVLKSSNALFGYEGDKHYFDLDIRRHFGLDKYNSNVIPYWKTETLEAMKAFEHRDGYATGAGECVSFSTLYAATLFVVAKIPLEKIHLFATPLHSQNFVEVRDGIITNNRRLLTKNMWFNGTELSAKARRALENEKVTMIVNNTGYVHTMYDTATMNNDSYDNITSQMESFLTTPITYTVMASFLRDRKELQHHFQIMTVRNKKPLYIAAEVVFNYEHSSQSRVGSESHRALLGEIDMDEFYAEPLEKRLILNELEKFLKKTKATKDHHKMIDELKEQLHHCCYDVDEVLEQLIQFSSMEPRLPKIEDKTIREDVPIELDPEMSREEVIEYLQSMRTQNRVVDLAFMALRDMNESPWLPFLKAAFERNPAIIEGVKDLSIDEVYAKLSEMPSESIYPEARFAQPDEVWNFGRGEGLEKAISFMVVLKQNFSDCTVGISFDSTSCTIRCDESSYQFNRSKEVTLPTQEDFKSFL